MAVLLHHFEDFHKRRFEEIRERQAAAENSIEDEVWNELAKQDQLVKDRDSLRKEKLPEPSGWYRPALYGILIFVILILSFYSALRIIELRATQSNPDAEGDHGADLRDAEVQRHGAPVPMWTWDAVKLGLYATLAIIATIAGWNNLLVVGRLKDFDKRVIAFANAAGGASTVLNSRGRSP